MMADMIQIPSQIKHGWLGTFLKMKVLMGKGMAIIHTWRILGTPLQRFGISGWLLWSSVDLC